MPAIPLDTHAPMRDWQLAVAIGFLALTVFGASVDRRTAVAGDLRPGARPAERTVAPPTAEAMIRDMLAHD